MTFWGRIIKKIRDIAAIPYRPKICAAMRETITNTEYSVIASNCNGAILTHDLGLEFRSPTVNLYFEAEGFVKFCENIDYYLSLVPIEVPELTEKQGYPVCQLDDVLLFCVHYETYDDLVHKWESRKLRINFHNIFLMYTDRNGCTNELVERFSKLPYKKIMFSHKPLPEYDFVQYVPGFEKESEVGQLHFYADFKGNRYYEKYFDIVKWLNNHE